MLIRRAAPLFSSPDEMDSIVSASRLVVLYEVLSGLNVSYEIMIVNRSVEKGGAETSSFVGKTSDKFAKIDFVYQGKIVGFPFLDRQNLKLNPEALAHVKVSTFGYITSAQKRRDILFSSSLQDGLTGEDSKYPSGEVILAPGPQFYTESHRVFTGHERQDFMSILMNDEGTFVTTIGALIDNKTKFQFCTVNMDQWMDSGVREYDSFMTNVLAQITFIQHACFVCFIDEFQLIMDTEDGFRPMKIESVEHPLNSVTRNDDGYVYFFALLEEAFSDLREIPSIPTRFYLRVSTDATQLRIVPKVKNAVNDIDKKRSKCDMLFYDFDNFYHS